MSRLSFSVKFLLDARTKKSERQYPLYLRVTVDRKKAEVKLGEYINPEKWDSVRARLINPTKFESCLNEKIVDVEQKVNLIRWELEREGKRVSARGIIEIFKNGKNSNDIPLMDHFATVIGEVEAKPAQYTPSVVRHYKQTRHRLGEYLQTIHQRDIRLSEFTRKHILEFEHYLLTTDVPVLNRPLNRNTCNRYLAKLKVTIKNAIAREMLHQDPFMGFKIHEVKPQRPYLTRQEVEMIRKHRLTGNESLIKVRDIFLFSVYTGLRFSDAMALSELNITRERNRLWITLTQQKTGIALELPILHQAKAIYQKYAEQRKATGFILPRLSHQKFNTFIKTVAELVGIKKTITHHIARHTSATLLLEAGVDLKLVATLLGQKSIKSAEIYARPTRTLLESIAEKMETEYARRRPKRKLRKLSKYLRVA